MRYTEYIVEDFVLDESFQNWALGKNRQDEAFWEQWIAEHPDMKPVVDEASHIIRGLQAEEVEVSREEIDQQFEEVSAFFDEQMARKTTKVRPIRRIAQIAATILVIMGLGALGYYYVLSPAGNDPAGNQEQIATKRDQMPSKAVSDPSVESMAVDTSKKQKDLSPQAEKEEAPSRNRSRVKQWDQPMAQSSKQDQKETKRHTTAGGEKTRIILPDGSRVFLNENSRLAYSGNWKNKETRKVRLQGEAYFKVEEKNDQGRDVKFIVSTRSLDVEVTGTAFDVNADNRKTSVYLNSGKVQLRIPGKSGSMAMKPGDLVEYNASTGNLNSRRTDNPSLISWLESFDEKLPGTSIPDNMTMSTQEDAQRNNQGNIWQSGEDNSAYIEQVGENLKSAQVQQGEDNKARADVTGQSGSGEAGWSTWQLQQGEGNVSIFNILQSYNSSLYSIQQGKGNVASGQSQGRDNTGVMLQQGRQNEALLLQRGKDNEALIIQKGPGNSPGSDRGFMQDLMEGRYNKVNIIQQGYNNKARTIQQGRNNQVNVNQQGQ
jgi:ferric-dicitrate binding protein FerR (iron transport regulator)